MTMQVPEGYNSVLVEFNPTEVKPYKVWNSDFCIEAEQRERVSWKGKAPHIVKSKVRVFRGLSERRLALFLSIH